MDNARLELIRKIQTQKEVFTILSRATRLPFVICDPESFNDQIWIFEEKETLEEAVKPLVEKKNPIASIRVENQSFLSFYTVLYTLGVNSVVYFGKDEKTELDLEEIVKKPDFSKLPEEKRPLLNPQLQLSGIYFMQELRRGVEMEEKEICRTWKRRPQRTWSRVNIWWLSISRKKDRVLKTCRFHISRHKMEIFTSRFFPMQKNSENSIKRINLLQCW